MADVTIDNLSQVLVPTTTDPLAIVDLDGGPAGVAATRKVDPPDLPREHGQIHGDPAPAAGDQSVSTTPAALPLGAWTSDQGSTPGIVPDEATGEITINRAGRYLVLASGTAVLTGTGTVSVQAYEVSGTPAAIAHLKASFSHATGEGAPWSFAGVLTAAAGDAIALYGFKTGASESVAWDVSSLTVVGLGATPAA